MAKLSAHGREVVRLERHTTLESGTPVRWTLILFEDRVILEKSDFYKNGKLDFSSGWKKRSKLTAEATPERWIEKYSAKGWTRA